MPQTKSQNSPQPTNNLKLFANIIRINPKGGTQLSSLTFLFLAVNSGVQQPTSTNRARKNPRVPVNTLQKKGFYHPI
jgi:hypothetical protein